MSKVNRDSDEEDAAENKRIIEEICDELNMLPEDFEPDPRDDEERYTHIRKNKVMLMCGWRCEGMSNRENSLRHMVRDIKEYTAWDDFYPAEQSAFTWSRHKFRQWYYSQHPLATWLDAKKWRMPTRHICRVGHE